MFFLENLETHEFITLNKVRNDDGFFSLAFPNGALVYRSEYSPDNRLDFNQVLVALGETAREPWQDDEVSYGFHSQDLLSYFLV
ncbi:hypothetical protein IQE94_06555 [Synechocystis sp. PCC 7339]|uniref:hypothetical protein n=1 Tax=unclassified Synechocystis TaxID=2640012 RepID=UPI001BAF4539|nr:MULTISPECIES: hypothetical protein [unclassified Synechocystis]QUS61723.1 hypothetical protein HTZ78_14340 [Synechocystis sp. PCC 7338]UAJ73921.1 hypothetical protein IQE94_06555 [Synechocystis sp. PCC 7339]